MGACGSSQLPKQQLALLQELVGKHVQESSLCDLANGDDFKATSTERGFSRWEHAHLVAAVDILNAYQRERSMQASCGPAAQRGKLRDDPETRLVELLKRWLRQRAVDAEIEEDELRSMGDLCRDVLNHQPLFVASGSRGLLRVMAEVHGHLRWQLCETLTKDNSCAEQMKQILSVTRNLVSDAVGFLLLAPSSLRETDKLASTEIVALWQTLPSESNPRPERADAQLQQCMQGAWRTKLGQLLAAVISAPWCVRLFDGLGCDRAGSAAAVLDCGAEPSSNLCGLISEAQADFERGSFKDSGLARALCSADQSTARSAYLAAVQLVADLGYLCGDVLVQFHRIGVGLGDYGVIRIAPWLHPFLELLGEKTRQLRKTLEQLNRVVDDTFVLARARGVPAKKPAPSKQMSVRAHAAIERVVLGRCAHAPALAEAIAELKERSVPDRLPQVMDGLGDACAALQACLSSAHFQACAGHKFSVEVPPLLALTGNSEC